MNDRRLRVIHVGTGNTGTDALRQILKHPFLDLVGLKVHSEAKEGKDAGELCGMPKCGVRATRDLDALLAMDADCVLYMATEWGRTQDQLIGELCRILASGKNVVTTTFIPLVYAKALGRSVTERLEAACKKGGTSFYGTGIEPGFTADVLTLTLTSLSEEIGSIRVHEHMNISSYAEPLQFEGYGFGLTAEESLRRHQAGTLSFLWSGTMTMLADGLGVELDAIRERRDVETTPYDLDLGWRTVKAGTVACIYFEIAGVVQGTPRLFVSHSYTLDDRVGHRWAPPTLPGRARHRNTAIVIDGTPPVRLDLTIGDDRRPETPGEIATASRAVHAIQAVCAAEPGIRTFFDLPPIMGTHMLRC